MRRTVSLRRPSRSTARIASASVAARARNSPWGPAAKSLGEVGYANKMRGQWDKHVIEEARVAGNAVEVIDVSEHKPHRIPSAKWRELIKKVWEADHDPFPDYDTEPVMMYASG